MKLTRSAYLAALHCLERLYRRYHSPRLVRPPELAQRMFVDQAKRVRALAREAFPGGVRLPWDGRREAEVAEHTSELIRDTSVRGLYEGAFEFNDVVVRTDILDRLDHDSWRLIEVKSSAGMKEQHLHELALQKYVLQGCGLKVASACILHLNRRYLHVGGDYDLERLFILRDLTGAIPPYERRVVENLPLFRSIIEGGERPDIPVNPLCHRPGPCEYYSACENNGWPMDSVRNLPESSPEMLAALAVLGISSIGEIPENYPLNTRQRRARRSIIEGRAVLDPGLAVVMEGLRYPLLFLDFEALSPALPRFDRMHPFDSLPFQWSIHRVDSEGAEPVHYEFLHLDSSDPREPFLDSLLEVVESSEGTIVAYSTDFESDRLKELAGCFPDRARRVEKVRARLWDLCAAIQGYVYHPEFRGSFSIKNVLPALVPGMSYSGMPVSHGVDAGAAWYRLIQGEMERAEREALVADLLDYCRLDTLAMVRLLRRLELEMQDVRRR